MWRNISATDMLPDLPSLTARASSPPSGTARSRFTRMVLFRSHESSSASSRFPSSVFDIATSVSRAIVHGRRYTPCPYTPMLPHPVRVHSPSHAHPQISRTRGLFCCTGTCCHLPCLGPSITVSRHRNHRTGIVITAVSEDLKMKLAPLLAVALVCNSLSLSLHAQKPESSSSTPASTVLKDYDEAFGQVAERVMRSVVQIDVISYSAPEHHEDEGDSQSLQRQRALGSGVIVDPDGYIVTNNHVVAGAIRIRVTLSPATLKMVTGHTVLSRKVRIYDATLIGTNPYADLAVIKIDEKDLPFIPLPAKYDVSLGQTVFCIGSPEGLDHTVTKGIISALGRQPDPDRPMVYIQTDSPINPGNSGGPLADRDGNLVGI